MSVHIKSHGLQPWQTKSDSVDVTPDAKGEVDVAKAVTEFMSAFEEYKATNDAVLSDLKKGVTDPLGEDKLKKIDSFLDKFEDTGQKLQQAQDTKKALDDLAERFKGLETAIARMAEVSGKSGDEQKQDKIDTWIRCAAKSIRNQNNETVLSENERKFMSDIAVELKNLNMGSSDHGGYLAPVELVRDIIKNIIEISPVRSIAKVRQTAMRAVEIPRRVGTFEAQWVAEEGTKNETDGLRYGMHEITPHEFYALVDITNQLLEDSMFNLAGEIMSETAEQFALAEGKAFVNGNGVGQPEGFLVNSEVPSMTSSTDNDITGAQSSSGQSSQGDDLIKLKYAVKMGYHAMARWVMRRTTIGRVRRLVDGEGAYLWQPGIAMGRPNMIDGDPYTEIPDMPTIAAGAAPIAYGDFMKAYCWVDRIQMEMLRDPYTQATAGQIRYIMRKRVGGKVVLPEAIIKLVVKSP